MIIKGILISFVAPMSDHIANAGEKILGNASSIKTRPDGRVYISGQKQRHALFAAMDRLNDDPATYVSNGDGITNVIEKDLRADLGGFLHTSKESYSGRRTAPLTATPAVALESSEIGRDLLIRLRVSQTEGKEQALATREFSQHDDMLMNFFIDISAVGMRRRSVYNGDMHTATEVVRHIDETERKRRIRLALEASSNLTDYANNARNATSGEPQKVLLVFDTRLSRKAARYFAPNTGATEKQNLLKELEMRSAVYFQGDDTGEEGTLSVAEAYAQALQFLDDNPLYNPAPNATTMTTEQFEKNAKTKG